MNRNHRLTSTAAAIATALVMGACATAEAPKAPAAPAAPAAARAATAPTVAPQAAAPAAAPAPAPRAWQQGRSSAMAASTLAPLAGRNTATTPAEIPVDKITLPPGFKAELRAHGMPGARARVRGDRGHIDVGTRGIGRVYEVVDEASERSTRVVVEKITQPAGVEFRNGSLYVMAIDKVLRFDGIQTNPAAQPVDMTVAFNLPPLQHHNWKRMRFDPDGKLSVPFGAPCNVCEPPPEHAQIRRHNADGSGMEVLARGVRNTVGVDWHPVTRERWFNDHGRDWMGDDTPSDELSRMPSNGLNYGFPYCHASGVADPDVKKDRPCDGVTLPVAETGAHAAVMGLALYTGSVFPADYRNQMRVVRKGSWNRTQKSGFDVPLVRTDADGKHVSSTPFTTGFMGPATDSFWGRPAYALQMPDGSVLISDEQLGATYRVSDRAP